jgi:hypothetical protein
VTDTNWKDNVCSTCSTHGIKEKRICKLLVNLKVKNNLSKPKSRCENSGHNVYSDYDLMVDFWELVINYLVLITIDKHLLCRKRKAEKQQNK